MTEQQIKFFKFCDNTIKQAKKNVDCDGEEQVIAKLTAVYQGKSYDFDWLMKYREVGHIAGVLLSGNVSEKIIRANFQSRHGWTFLLNDIESVRIEIFSFEKGQYIVDYTRYNTDKKEIKHEHETN